MKKAVLLVFLLHVLAPGCALTEKKLSRLVAGAKVVTHEFSGQSLIALKQMPVSLPPEKVIGLKEYPDNDIFEICVGPVEVPAGSHRTMLVATALPFDVFIQGFDWAVTDKAGRTLPREFLHHVNIIEPGKRELFAPIARRLLAIGSDTAPASIPWFIGIPVKGQNPVLVAAMLSNNSGRHQSASLRIWLAYSRPGSGLFNPREVFPFYLDTAGFTGLKEFEVPPGLSTHSWDSSPVVNGRILAIGGHIHKYGKYLQFDDMDESRILWKARPRVDEAGRITAVPSNFFLFSGEPLNTKHTYRIAVQYFNPLEHPSPDMGMGTIGGLFRPSAEPGWDQPDYHNAEYRADMAYLQSAYSDSAPHMGHMHH